MNFRNFGETGPSVSEIGLGCWQLGGDWGNVDDYTAQKVLEGAVQSELTFTILPMYMAKDDLKNFSINI